MTDLHEVTRALRRKNISQYGLLWGCFFFSVLLITAFVTILCSPTIQTILPEGGDSRKQVMMIFVMTMIGCGVFTIYASGLFFRYKSREVGSLLALGAGKKAVGKILLRELAMIALSSCILGSVLGSPLAWLLWKGFRLLIVDTKEMKLILVPEAYGYTLCFSCFVFLMLYLMMRRFLGRTNVMDIMYESHKTETLRLVPQWYGWGGILLLAAGAFLGYQMPSVFIFGFKWYPPDWLMAPFYLPVLVGLYMILLHTVVNGWKSGKNRYKDLITTSMMRFQGRQTVRNMIVITLLVAGAYFAAFYFPMMATSSSWLYQNRSIDFFFHYQTDQAMPDETKIRKMAEENQVVITEYGEVPISILGIDGWEYVEETGVMGTTYDEVYQELTSSDSFLSASSYQKLSGRTVSVEKGKVMTVLNDEGKDDGRVDKEIHYVTNPVTGKVLPVTPTEDSEANSVFFGYRILNDEDYAVITEGLSGSWKENAVAFNVDEVGKTYAFAKQLYYELISCSSEEAAVPYYYDPLSKQLAEQTGKDYTFGQEKLDYSKKDSAEFRTFWKYMPQFRVMDEKDFLKTMSVCIMLFVFVTIICFAAVGLILTTRSVTVALMNRRIYEDLKKLGASGNYLRQTVRNQTSRLFFVPVLTGTVMILCFYGMILYFNDNGFSGSELAAARTILLIVAAVSALIYGLYRILLRKIEKSLGLS